MTPLLLVHGQSLRTFWPGIEVLSLLCSSIRAVCLLSGNLLNSATYYDEACGLRVNRLVTAVVRGICYLLASQVWPLGPGPVACLTVGKNVLLSKLVTDWSQTFSYLLT
jgi:hypothetical protein